MSEKDAKQPQANSSDSGNAAIKTGSGSRGDFVQEQILEQEERRSPEPNSDDGKENEFGTGLDNREEALLSKKKSFLTLVAAIVSVIVGLVFLWDRIFEEPTYRWNYEIIVDQSADMINDFGATTKWMAIAEAVSISLKEDMDPEYNIALRRFGDPCDDQNSALLEEFGTNNIEAIKAKLQHPELRGEATVLDALRKATADFNDVRKFPRDVNNKIILFSGHINACSGEDIVEWLRKKFHGTNMLVELNFVAIGVSHEQRARFERLAKEIPEIQLYFADVQFELNQIAKDVMGTTQASYQEQHKGETNNQIEKNVSGTGSIRPDTAASEFQDQLEDGSKGPLMLHVPAGDFVIFEHIREDMPPKINARNITISKPFAIGKYEITFGEYDRFARENDRELPSDYNMGRGDRPVVGVNWNEAVAYAEWLSNVTGKQYRLPSEIEWEYAARAGSNTDYWWGNEIGVDQANCRGCGNGWGETTAPVGQFRPNAFGLHQTAGNVWEWVDDCWHENYIDGPNDERAWENEDGAECELRVVRGGSWGDGTSNVKSTERAGAAETTRSKLIGFRLVRWVD